MICPECNGKGAVKYYREINRDENSVTVKGFLDVCHTCHGSGNKPMTNADHIRSMTDEELAPVIMCPYDVGPDLCNSVKTCNECCLDWLKQPYEEENHGKA